MQPITLGDGAVIRHVVAERQVWYNHAVDAALPTIATKRLEAVLHDRVQITHEEEWHGHCGTNIAQLIKKQAQAHAVFQRP